MLALPALLDVRSGVFVAHWAGRLRAGIATEEDLRVRAERALLVARWIARNGESLARHALGSIGVRA